MLHVQEPYFCTTKQDMHDQCVYGVILQAMMTSSNGNISRVTGPLCGEFIGHRWIPLTKPVTRSFDVFFDLNKR